MYSPDQIVIEVHQAPESDSERSYLIECGKLPSVRYHEVSFESRQDADESGTASVPRLFFTTLGLLGVQIVWAIKQSNTLPYMLSVGMTKSSMAMVWAAAPILGSLIQLLMGLKSDSCQIAWGRRRPYILGSVMVANLGLLGLAWAKEIISPLLALFGYNTVVGLGKVCYLAWIVLFMYTLDFAIAAVEATTRAMMVDSIPARQQDTGNAIASCMLSAGNILGYAIGYIDFEESSWFNGHSQFKTLVLVGILCLTTATFISGLQTPEQNPRLSSTTTKEQPNNTTNLCALLSNTLRTIRHLPPNTKKVFRIQFFVWLGWFVFLFNATTWISELWTASHLLDHFQNPTMPSEESDLLLGEATRIGNYLLLIWSISSLACNLSILLCIAPRCDSSDSLTEQTNTPSPPPRRLRRIWTCSLVLLSIFLVSAPWISSITVAGTGMFLIGTSWATTLWAPFSIISSELSTTHNQPRRSTSHTNHGTIIISAAAAEEEECLILDTESSTPQAGVILGLQGLVLAASQIIGFVITAFVLYLTSIEPSSSSSSPLIHGGESQQQQQQQPLKPDGSLPAVFFVVGLSVMVGALLACFSWA